MARGYYINYIIEYSKIFEKLNQHNYNKINFFIDLQSIATGFYNKDTVLVEVGRYAENNKISDLLFNEFYNYLENLYNRFQKYDPYFVTFYDDGYCQQNRTLLKEYKSENSIKHTILLDDEYLQLFKNIKKYYFNKIFKIFNRHVSSVFYLKEYESDFIPHYCLKNNLFDSNEPNVLNIILSKDKDLLQTCQFKNTYQIVTTFRQKKQERFCQIYDDNNAITYMYKNFKPGILTSKDIPLLLALSGDEADGVPGITGIGPAKAVNLLQGLYNVGIPNNVNELMNLYNQNKLPKIISDNIKKIKISYQLTSFEEQISRIPTTFFNDLFKRQMNEDVRA